MENPTTTRRDMLRMGTSAAVCTAGLAIGSASAVLPNPAHAAEPQRAEWDALCAAYYVAREEEVRTGKIEDARQSDVFEAASPQPKRPRPEPVDKSLSLATILAQSDSAEWQAKWADYERELATWKDHQAALEARIMGDTSVVYDKAMKACDEAFLRVRQYPVTSIAMLNEKAAVMNHRYAGDFEGHDAEQLMNDIARLAEGR